MDALRALEDRELRSLEAEGKTDDRRPLRSYTRWPPAQGACGPEGRPLRWDDRSAGTTNYKNREKEKRKEKIGEKQEG
jgi:hypothetical protein